MSKVYNLTGHIIELYNPQDGNYITIHPTYKDFHVVSDDGDIKSNTELVMINDSTLNNGDIFPVKFKRTTENKIRMVCDGEVISRSDIIILTDMGVKINNIHKNLYVLDPKFTIQISVHEYDSKKVVYRCDSLIRL